MMDEYRDIRHLSFEHAGDKDELSRIRNERYSSPASLRFPFSVGDAPAFVMLCGQLHSLTSAINQANLKLERLSMRIPRDAVQQFFIGTMIEEIQQTNEVENVHSTRKEIREAVNAMNNGQERKRFAGMARKYDMLLNDTDISLRSCMDIRRLYDEFILDEVLREDADNAPDGLIFRKGVTAVYSGKNQKIHEGLYPEAKIVEVMDGALLTLNDTDIDPLVRVAVFHYAFAYIHPFYDGNGRMTRFISSYVLSKYFNKAACLRIAYTIKAQRSQYYRMFKEANDKRNMGDLTAFVLQFLQFFKQAIEESYSSLLNKKERFDRYKQLLGLALKVQYPDMSAHYSVLLEVMLQTELFGHPEFSLAQIAEVLSCNQRTARIMLDKCGSLVYHKNEGRKFLWHIDLDEIERLAQA